MKQQLKKPLRIALVAAVALGALIYSQMDFSGGTETELPISAYGELAEPISQEPVAASEEEQVVDETVSQVETESEQLAQPTVEVKEPDQAKLEDEAYKSRSDLMNIEAEVSEIQKNFKEERVYIEDKPEAPARREASISEAAILAGVETPEAFEPKPEKKTAGPRVDDAKIEKEVEAKVAKALAEGSIKQKDKKVYASYLRRLAIEAALDDQSMHDDSEGAVLFVDSTVSSVD